jgi:hypothetical protein
MKRYIKRYIGLLVLASALITLTDAVAADALASKQAPSETSTASEPATTDQKFAIDSSLEVNSRRSVFEYAGLTFAPWGSEKSGLRMKIESVNGGYYYNQQGDLESNQLLIHGHFLGGTASVGYEYVGDTLSVAGFVGGDYQHESLSFQDPANPTRGTHWGVKFAGEADYRPEESTSLFLMGQFSTANDSWWSKFRPGYAVMPGVFVGPEVGYQGDNFYQTWKVGAHMRGFKVGALQIGLASGFLRNSVIGNGVYGAIDASLRF